MNYAIEILKVLNSLENFQYDRRKIEKELKLSERYIDQILAKGGNEKILNRLLELLERLKLQNPTVDADKISDVSDLKLQLAETKIGGKSKKVDDTRTDNLSVKAIYELTSSNKILAESHKILAETNAKLADKIIDVTANDPAQIPQVSGAIFHNLRELLVNVATGKKYHSEQEVRALLNKVDSSPASKVSVAGTRRN